MVITSLLSIIFEEHVTKWHVVAAISINLALGDFAYSGGFFPTLLDLAPNYAGLLSGVSTFIAFVTACPSTYVNSIIIKQVRKQILLNILYIWLLQLKSDHWIANKIILNHNNIYVYTIQGIAGIGYLMLLYACFFLKLLWNF
jgi:hypothetical protein